MVILRATLSFIALMLTLIVSALSLHLPDARLISYGASAPSSSYTYLRLLDVDRRLDVQLLPYPVLDGVTSWSPDGEQVAYNSISLTGSYLHIFDRRTGEIITPLEGELEADAHAWSPDSDCFAYTLDGALYRYCLGAQEPELLHRDRRKIFLDWSPDGERLIYNVTEMLYHNLYEFDLTTKRERQITNDGVAKSYVNYTPDGNSVIYSSFKGDTAYLFEFDIETSSLQQLTSGGDEYAPSVSQNGRYIAYISHEAATGWNLYMLDRETGGIQRLTSSDGDEFAPQWVP